MSSIAWVRRQAVGWSLATSDTLSEAFAAMEFVQADPIRSPARAQDLILRHRVTGYRIDDLDRAYPSLEIDEDALYAYGFVTRRLRSLLYPRTYPNSPGGHYLPEGLAAEVLAFVLSHGITHPRQVQAQFGRRRVRNDWGGQSTETTVVLETLRHYGLLRVGRRERGVRLYEVAAPLGPALEPSERVRKLVLRIARTLAPISEASLTEAAAVLRNLAKRAHGTSRRQPIIANLLASGELEAGEAGGVRYLWPADLRPFDAELPTKVSFLAPFDPLVWDRRRFEHLWDWAYRFEAYTPPVKRRLGYYAMPLMWRDDVIGWANCVQSSEGYSVQVGFTGTRPAHRSFTLALDEEISQLRAFLTPRQTV